MWFSPLLICKQIKIHPFRALFDDWVFRPLRRATEGLCPSESCKPLKRLDLNFNALRVAVGRSYAKVTCSMTKSSRASGR